MDFFQAQEAAHKRTKRLVFYYLAAIALIIASVYATFVLLFREERQIQQRRSDQYGYYQSAPQSESPINWWQPALLGAVAVGTLGLIAGGTLFKSAALRSGGGSVARMMGGRRIAPDTTDLAERRLVNVVEEMAIAAGIRVPEIYLLDDQTGINAFASGFSPDDAAVTVTRGCLEQLSRDELQGVIGHEFSHILNGDMRMNIRLIGLLFGIMLLAILGEILFRTAGEIGFLGGVRRRDGKDNGMLVFLFLLGLALTIIGYIGVFFGRLIQSAVSRQREFLADASSVQFTRNPAGITGALKKIGGWKDGAAVRSHHTAETSHLFFANALKGSAMNLFATHPSLVDRIRAIDPQFDGNFKAVESRSRAAVSPAAQPQKPTKALRPDSLIAGIGLLAQQQVTAAAGILNRIPQPLREAARNPESAVLVIYALLLEHSETGAQKQLARLSENLNQSEIEVLQTLVSHIASADESAWLPILDLAVGSARNCRPEKAAKVLSIVDQLILSNNEVSLFEFAVKAIIRRAFPVRPSDRRPEATTYFTIKALIPEFLLVLSATAHAGSIEGSEIETAFRSGINRIDELKGKSELIPVDAINWPSVDNALAKFNQASLPIKKRLMDACAHAIAADGRIKTAETEVIRAIGATLNCPVPPLGV